MKIELETDKFVKFEEKYKNVDLLDINFYGLYKPSEIKYLHIAISTEIASIHEILRSNPTDVRGTRIPQLYNMDRWAILKLMHLTNQKNQSYEKKITNNHQHRLEFQRTIKVLREFVGDDKFEELTGYKLTRNIPTNEINTSEGKE